MKALRRMGDRLGSTTRVVAAILGLLVVALAISGVVAVRTLEDELIERIDARVVDDARSTARALEVLSPADLAELAEVSQAGRPGTSTTAVVVLDGDGDVVFASPSGPRDTPDPLPAIPDASALADRSGTPFTAASADGSVEFRAVSTAIDGGTILVASPLDGAQDTVRVLRERLLLIGGIVAAVLAAFFWAVIAAANRQVDHMIDAATRIGDGDLSARIDELPAGTSGGRLGHALNHMLHQLEVAFAAREGSEDRLRRFAADASHELRTPLTHIRGYAELLRSGAAATPQDHDRALERIDGEATRMAALIEDLLLLARLDQGRPLDTQLVDLGTLVTDSVDDACAVEPDRPITVEVPAEPVTATGDEARLRQVLANLLANIRAHTPAGTPARVTLDHHDGVATLTVYDEGPGMTAEAAARAFDRFYRPEDSRSRATGGSGLGLAITAGIVAAHHGTITLDAAPGAGARFTITLPTRPLPAIGHSDREPSNSHSRVR